jgi:hypothetical protein
VVNIMIYLLNTYNKKLNSLQILNINQKLLKIVKMTLYLAKFQFYQQNEN